ncbi:hypothetical protein MHU86_23382 [Fragilaria crotonensis]|nr:hypothetical protein MHU86_23382 [Fragilaria crotonensis]
MSFQDVGKPGAPQRPLRSHYATQAAIPEGRPSGSLPKIGDPFAQLSDGILQYQRNVGILEKITRQMGTDMDGPELQTQYSVQVDVLKQLGGKLESNLKLQETQLNQTPRTEAAKRRATLIKLNRDFRRVEAVFKNLMLDTRRQNVPLKDRQQNHYQPDSGAGADISEEEQRMQLELQLQQDLLNEELMRERENEIRNINRGMHQVNEIYKDLAHIVGSQQEQIDQIEGQMENSRANAEQGLSHIQKANEKASASSQCTIS